MTRIITAEEFIGAVRAVLTKRGDSFVYREAAASESGLTCVYSEDYGETGSCLFGAALIDELDVEYDPCWEGTTIAQILNNYVDPALHFDAPVSLKDAAYDAQNLQDSGARYRRVSEEFEDALSDIEI